MSRHIFAVDVRCHRCGDVAGTARLDLTDPVHPLAALITPPDELANHCQEKP